MYLGSCSNKTRPNCCTPMHMNRTPWSCDRSWELVDRRMRHYTAWMSQDMKAIIRADRRRMLNNGQELHSAVCFWLERMLVSKITLWFSDRQFIIIFLYTAKHFYRLKTCILCFLVASKHLALLKHRIYVNIRDVPDSNFDLIPDTKIQCGFVPTLFWSSKPVSWCSERYWVTMLLFICFTYNNRDKLEIEIKLS